MTIPLGWAQTRCAQTRSARTLRLLSVGLVATLGVGRGAGPQDPVHRHQAQERAARDRLRRSRRAGLLDRRQLQRRLARRTQGPHRLRASLRAHDVQGLRERRPGEHSYLIFINGGSMNGTTNKDRTIYYETLPANQLDLALFLEADRMRSLAITKENLDNQRNAVQEERRLRRRQPAVRQDVRGDRRARLRELRLRALGDRLDGRSERRDGRRRVGVLQDLLRAEQRGPRDRRRRRYEDDAREGARSTSTRFPRSRRRRRST